MVSFSASLPPSEPAQILSPDSRPTGADMNKQFNLYRCCHQRVCAKRLPGVDGKFDRVGPGGIREFIPVQARARCTRFVVMTTQPGLSPDSASIQALERRARTLMDLDPVERMSAVAELMSSLDGVDEYTIARLELYEACRKASLDAVDELQKTNIGLEVPLAENEFAYITLMLRTLITLCEEYDELANLVDEEFEESPGDQDLREPYCIHRQLELLEAVTMVAALAYYPQPPGLWVKVHVALERAIELKALDFVPREDQTNLSIGDLYATLLLIGLADPYRLAFRELRSVAKFVRSSADRAVLRSGHTFTATGAERYLFVVDFDLDVPALPWRASRPMDGKSIDLVFDVTQVVVRARNRQLTVRAEPDTVDPLMQGQSSDSIDALYKHLVVEWGKQPIRQNPRTPEVQRYDVVVGFEALRKTPQLEAGAGSSGEEIVMSGGVGTGLSTASATLDDVSSTTGTSLDVSATGIRLRITGSASISAQVGEVIAFRRLDTAQSDSDKTTAVSTDWTVGILRWVSATSPDEFEAGILVLGTVETTGSLMDFDTLSETTQSVPVVVVTQSPYRSSQYWVLCRDPQPDPTRSRRMITDGENVTLESLRVALQTRQVACHNAKVQINPGAKDYSPSRDLGIE